MKASIAFLLLALLLAATQDSSAPTVTLAWNPSPSPEVTGYHLYQGYSSQNYGAPTEVPGIATSIYTVSNLVQGTTYYFNLTAHDGFGLESVFAGEVNFTSQAPPPPQTNLRVVGP